MAKSRKRAAASRATTIPLVPVAAVEPTIRLEREPEGTWAYSAWEPGSADTHSLVEGELGRIDTRRYRGDLSDPIGRLPTLIEHQVASWRVAYAAILKLVPESHDGWKTGGVIRMTIDPELVRKRNAARAQRRAQTGFADAGETRSAAPTFAGFGNE